MVVVECTIITIPGLSQLLKDPDAYELTDNQLLQVVACHAFHLRNVLRIHFGNKSTVLTKTVDTFITMYLSSGSSNRSSLTTRTTRSRFSHWLNVGSRRRCCRRPTVFSPAALPSATSFLQSSSTNHGCSSLQSSNEYHAAHQLSPAHQRHQLSLPQQHCLRPSSRWETFPFSPCPHTQPTTSALYMHTHVYSFNIHSVYVAYTLT